MDKHTALTIVIIYMILLLPPMIQTQKLSKKYIDENDLLKVMSYKKRKLIKIHPKFIDSHSSRYLFIHFFSLKEHYLLIYLMNRFIVSFKILLCYPF